MKIAIAQLNTCAGEFEKTVNRMVELSARAADQGVELLVFPLATLTGVAPVSYESSEGWMHDTANALERLSHEVFCPCLVPYVHAAGDAAYPNVVVLESGHTYTIADLTKAEEHGSEPRGRSLLSWKGLTFGVAFTYEDIDAFIDSSTKMDVLLFASGYSYALDDAGSALGAALLDNRFRADATTLDAYVMGVGSLGGYGLQVFAGASFVLTPRGELAASAPAFEESLLCASVGADEPVDEPLEPELYNRSLHLWEVLVLGLHDYLAKLGIPNVALILDGTLASCLLASLATDALGPTHVYVLPNASEDLRDAASSLVDALRVQLLERPMWLDSSELTITPRMLQAFLADRAQRHDALPISSEDKTFLSLEMNSTPCLMAALLPFGDVYRSDVIELAHMRNTISPVIPRACLRAYTVPLVEGLSNVEHTPETQLRRVDVTLSTHIEWERTLTDVVARQGASHITEQIVRQLYDCELGRVTCPPCLTASSRTIFDIRRPLGLTWHDRVRDEEERLKSNELLKHLGGVTRESEMQAFAGEQQLGEGLAGLLDGLGAELIAGSLPEGVDKRTMERSLDDLLGLIQDIMQGEGFSPEGNGFDGGGPFGPLTWGSPFSEN